MNNRYSLDYKKKFSDKILFIFAWATLIMNILILVNLLIAVEIIDMCFESNFNTFHFNPFGLYLCSSLELGLKILFDL